LRKMAKPLIHRIYTKLFETRRFSQASFTEPTIADDSEDRSLAWLIAGVVTRAPRSRRSA
jgi:hypothetical protein